MISSETMKLARKKMSRDEHAADMNEADVKDLIDGFDPLVVIALQEKLKVRISEMIPPESAEKSEENLIDALLGSLATIGGQKIFGGYFEKLFAEHEEENDK